MKEQTTLSILGDSYSTYKGWIPKDYEAWYADSGTSEPNDVNSVEQTWWHMLCEEKNFKLLQNCSYSGSTVCNTGYVPILSARISFIKRMVRELGPEQEQKADVLIVFGATNDFWAESPVGKIQYEDWTSSDLKKFAPAFCYMMHHLKKWNPDTVIYNVVNDDISGELKEIITEVCEHYCITNIELKDIEKENGHPNRNGMCRIKEQIAEVIGNCSRQL